jgi:hypothetical protein
MAMRQRSIMNVGKRGASPPMKEVVLVTLSIDAKTGQIDHAAPFLVSPP